MAGGTFDRMVGKERPGTYVNKESARIDVVKLAERGTVLIPLSMDWGPVHEFITITNAAVDGQYSKLGYSIYDNDPLGSMLLIREAFKLAQKVVVYRLSGGTNAAAPAVGGLSAKAKWPGTRGNDLRLVIEESPISEGSFDLAVYLDTAIVFEQSGASTIGDLEDNDWVDWSGEKTAALIATGGAVFTGGANDEKTNLDVTGFLDASESIVWNGVAFPFEDASLQSALKTKILYFRDDVGKKVAAAAPNFKANAEGIDCVVNGVILNDGTEIDATKACAWVAAAGAAASNTQSNTYLVYDGAVDVLGKKTHDDAVSSIKAGEMFFSVVNGNVVVEYDINSLTDFNPPRSKDYRKNRVRRVLDTLDESIQLNFPPNKFDNSPDGWDLMESVGKQILLSFSDAGALKNVDLDNDFVVDRAASVGDEAYVTVGASPTDSAEKLYFTVRTR